MTYEMENKTTSKFIEAKKTIEQFLQESIQGESIKVVKLERESDEWQAKAEAYEDDSFLKAMNLPAKKTRVFFSVRLDAELDVIAFERLNGNE